ncbi:uncharacterized protein LOC123559228 [Mercenaria mercenaria]|uniref:uncharacterized protein LOC123559228 n=1 Tax=Mercenaria mercenaria TaxID=6596 RepID=UPI00234F7C4D|nr:uncharacterized protein LOC123559228 [Mercenaria mercenaria]XP_053400265.1 uncharacterized protein LOC123559228 [Mercenaria mercenaria]
MRHHQNILAQIFRSVPVSNCNQCNLKKLKPNHVRDRNKQCPLGHAKCNCQYPNGKMACPNNICGDFYDKIIRSHASSPPKPYWDNVNSMFWCTNHWEFGKCFINAPGYVSKTKASEIDCSGLLHVIINNIEFHSHIQSCITGSDVFSQARVIRNELFHSSMELDDTKADEYIDMMIAVLEDPKELLMRQKCITAAQKLKELKKNKLIITQETEEEVLKAAAYIIEEDRMKYLHQRVNDLEDKFQRKNMDLGRVKRKTNEDLKMLKKKRMEDKENLDKSMSSLSDRISSLESKDKETASSKKTLEDIQSSQAHHKAQLEYVRRKHDLKRKLIDIYKRMVIKNSVLPLRYGRSVCIGDVYVLPWMVVANEGARNRQMKDGIDVTSLTEIFYKDGEPVQNIYILGEAGYGKTMLTKYVVYEWCLTHAEDGQIESHAEEGHIEELKMFAEKMKEFDFLFFLSLRYNKAVEGNNIHKMIENQFGQTALEILENESGTCLILMDGLDEWTPSLQPSSSQFQPQGIPLKSLTKDYTIITTSRPWKPRALNLDESEMVQLIELRGIRKYSVESFVNKATKYVDESCDAEAFTADIKKSSVFDLATIPFMLLQLIRVWVVSKHIASSRCDISCSLLGSMFAWSAQSDRKENILKVVRDNEDFCSDVRFDAIKSVQNLKLCKESKFLILKAAKVFYSMLFSNETYSVTTTQNDLRSLGIDEQIENIFLELGLFTLDRDINVFPTEQAYSFVHTILQEYLAALYITTQCQTTSPTDYSVDNFKVIDEHLKYCKTIDDVCKHANLLEMICTLDSTLTTSISEFVFRIVNADKQVQKYRKTTENYDYEMMYKIQDIIFSCTSESFSNEPCNSISLGDLVIDSSTDVALYENINPRKVRSIYVLECDKLNEEFFECKSLSEYPIDDADNSDSDLSHHTRESDNEPYEISSESSGSGSQSDWLVDDNESTDDMSCIENEGKDESPDNSTESSISVDGNYDLDNGEGERDSGFIGRRERYSSDANNESRQIYSYDDGLSETDSSGETSMNIESLDHGNGNDIGGNEETQTPNVDFGESEKHYLNFLAKNAHKCQPDKVCIVKCSLSDGDVMAIRKMIGNCSQTLKCVAIQQKQMFPCSDSPIVSTLIMSKATLLTSLDLRLCESLPHEDMIRLARLLERNLGLEQITLAQIKCASMVCQDDHECNFVQHKHLKKITFTSCDFLANAICSKKLQVCKLDCLDQTIVRNIMFSINLSEITVFHLGMVRFGRDDILFPYLAFLKEIRFEKVEMNQVSWLSFITKLRSMALSDIEIKRLTISQEAWNRFIDGLSELGKDKSVHIDTYNLRVRQFQSPLSFADASGKEVTDEARQYVKENGFCVLHDNDDTFEFEKKLVETSTSTI